jgi:hypothetical protein
MSLKVILLFSHSIILDLFITNKKRHSTTPTMTIIEDAVACDVASHNHTFHLTASQQIRAIEPVEKVPRTDFEGFLIKLGDKKWRI